MENPTETTTNQPQGLTPTQQPITSNGLNPKLKTEIVQQIEAKDAIAAYLLSIWVTARIHIMQMSPSLVPSESPEEFGLIRRLMAQYGTITPSEFAECIRLAAIDKQRDLSAGTVTFPTLYAADFEEQIQKLTLKRMKETPTKLELPANTGGNSFFGEPSEALQREWPKIKAQTELLRKTINVNLRDRFWVGGQKPQQEAARAMLAQMVHEMKAADFWQQKQCDWEALAIFQAEYKREFHGWYYLIEAGMDCPMKATQISELKARTEKKIAAAFANGGSAPSIDLFPDPQDCYFCAIFDLYWKFWEGLQNAD